jgi:hypothetical protein
MASAFITVRQADSGRRSVVRYRLGGRAYPIAHGGEFSNYEGGSRWRDFIAGELAAGRNPADTLRAQAERPKVRTFAGESPASRRREYVWAPCWD